MDDFGTHIRITQALYFIIHLIILLASVIIAKKSKSVGAILLVVSSALTLLNTFADVFLSNVTSLFGDNIKFHSIFLYFNVIVYSMFGLGLILFAVDNWKKYN